MRITPEIVLAVFLQHMNTELERKTGWGRMELKQIMKTAYEKTIAQLKEE